MLVSAESVGDVQAAVRGASRIVPRSGGSKPALSQSAEDPDLTVLDVSRLSGIIEYDPAELTFSAQAATPVRDIAAVLAEHGQYLPFDPPRRAAGATLAGVLAAATSGPGAVRHGGVRDFIIGVGLVDGRGRLVSGGAKVVKNAAGFDLPKLMVGSLGRLGIMVRLSFKVFPRPRATTTLSFTFGHREAALAAMIALARGQLMPDALDIDAEGALLVRLGGDPDALGVRADRCAALVAASHGAPVAHQRRVGVHEGEFWDEAAEFTWAPADSVMVRVALNPHVALNLLDILGAIRVPVRLSLAGDLAWVAWPRERPLEELERRLAKVGVRGLALDGAVGRSPLLGGAAGGAFAERIRDALDPDHRFLEF